MLVMILKLVFLVIISYLIGAIPTGYLIVKKLKGIDIRETGSGSTGATNVKRILGTKWFFIVMIIDALKGIIPVYIATRWFNNFYDIYNIPPVLAAVATVIGHSKSVFIKFTGGKSVATAMGTFLVLYPVIGLIGIAIWGIITFISKTVSLGSIIAVVMIAFMMGGIPYFNAPTPYIWYSSACAIYIIFTHRDNLDRLLKKKEDKVRK